MKIIAFAWYHQQESNLYLALRRHSFYPLNYGGGFCDPCNGCGDPELYSLAALSYVAQ